MSDNPDVPPEHSSESTSEHLTRRLLSPTKSASVGLYPHDIHPGLVPGIGVDEQRNRFGLDRGVFFVTAALILAFIAWGG